MLANNIHLDSWSHGKVLVNMNYDQLQDRIILERMRGPKPSYKSVHWGTEDSLHVISALFAAVLNPPTSAVPYTVPVGRVATRLCTISIDWIPYQYGREYALRMQQESGNSVTIEIEDTPCFALWVPTTLQNAQAEGLFTMLKDQAY